MQHEVRHTDGLVTPEVFLRSINIRYDAEHPERIAHFVPTAKSVPLVNALAGRDEDRAFFIVAPYGSGKSITASYLLHLVENRSDHADTLLSIQKKLSGVSPELGKFAANRRRQKSRFGIALTLQGYCESVAESIKSAAVEAMLRVKLGREARTIQGMPCNNIDEAIEILSVIREKALSISCDRIVIIWDEFGRHLESLLAEGRPSALMGIQTLAEFVSRSKGIVMTFGLLLHQGISQYAGNASQSVLREWKKIEGRFRTIQYVDDSKEIYRLICQVVSSLKGQDNESPSNIAAVGSECHKYGLFSDFEKTELADLFSRAYPLEPTTLYLLPRLSARAAQNERTLFSFFYSTDLTSPLGPEVLYDYFSPAMQSDTAVGGTYRQWLETQSALSKTGDDEDARRALKIACLLGLGVGGERSRTSLNLLLFALRGCVGRNGQDAVIQKLVDSKLLLHRKHSDEVSVWHGTDADLRGKLEEEKQRQRAHFDLLDFLSKEVLPPVYRPLEYNSNFGVRRYLIGEYHSLSTVESYSNNELPLDKMPVGCDGKILYLIAQNAEELEAAGKTVRQKLRHPRVILALSREPLSLLDAALEVWCLSQMQLDSDLVESDPLISSELQQMTDDAREHLQRLVNRLVRPSPNGPRWFCDNREFEAESIGELRRELSDLMREVYSLTPRINNEMIVRNKPSGTIVNARKKLMLGILERSGRENFGIEGNFPDASMFRTVLLNTGIYQKENGRWSYALPESIKDEGLREVWGKIRDFFTLPSKEPKNPRDLFEKLMGPPFGLRAGLLPILFAAGLKAFPSTLSLTKNGTYLNDILPSEIEQLCKEADLYRLEVLELDEEKLAYLRGLHDSFSPHSASEIQEIDIIRACFDAIEDWKGKLPKAAFTTRRISERALHFRNVIFRESDPVRILLEKIPAICGYKISQYDELITTLRECRDELMELSSIYRRQASTSVERALILSHTGSNSDTREIAVSWANYFSEKFTEDLLDGIAKGLLFRMRMPYPSDEKLLDSLSSLLVGMPLERWDDSTITIFDREFKSVVRSVEEAALHAAVNASLKGVTDNGLVHLIQGKIAELFERLISLVGADEAKRMLARMGKERVLRSSDGHDPRSPKSSKR